MSEMEIDSEHIISEVEKHPELYDPNDELYKNKNSRLESWQNVIEAVVGKKYDDFDDEEKDNIGTAIQRRWKSLKDAFARSLKLQAHRRKTGAIKKIKPYAFQKQMTFLQPILESRPIFEHMDDSSEEEEQKVETVPEAFSNGTPLRAKPVVGVLTLPKRRRDSDELFEKQRRAGSTFRDYLSEPNQPQPKEEDDPDKMFLLSLLPRIRELEPSTKFDFQIKVMQLLQEYLGYSQIT